MSGTAKGAAKPKVLNTSIRMLLPSTVMRQEADSIYDATQ
jgi:hypothetical protein